jgi:hypothetical protein
MYQITRDEFYQYMYLLEAEIFDIKIKYNDLQATVNDWNDKFDPASKKSGLSLESIKDLQKSMVIRQHELFRQWYKMNNTTTDRGYIKHFTAQKEQDIGKLILHKTRWMDVIKEV